MNYREFENEELRLKLAAKGLTLFGYNGIVARFDALGEKILMLTINPLLINSGWRIQHYHYLAEYGTQVWIEKV